MKTRELSEVIHDGQYFTIDFNDDGGVVDVWLHVYGGFTCDCIKVTQYIGETLMQEFQSKIDFICSKEPDEMSLARSFEDYKKDESA
jgi:hypothetical protein